MNKVILIGRLTKDPDVRYNNAENGQMCIAKYTLAVNRKTKDNVADFINCVAFGKTGEFAEKYLARGTKIAIEGRIQTSSYDDKDGKRIWTTNVYVENHYFCEKKGTSAPAAGDGFMNIPEGIDEELPFN